MTALDVRPLGSDDVDDWGRVCLDSFGYAPSPEDAHDQLTQEGSSPWGLFDSGELVATVTTIDFDSRWGGADIRTAGVSAATVLPEYRGRGHFRLLLETALAGAGDRGALISTLFPTARGVYRRMGFESVTRVDTLEIRTAELSRPAASGCRLRRGDLDELAELYRAWGEPFNGPASMLPGQNARVLRADARRHKVTVIDDAGEAVGAVAWCLVPGGGAASVLEIADVVATGAEALNALPAFLAGFSAIAPTARLRGMTPAWQQMVLPDAEASILDTTPYMLRVLDMTLLEELRFPVGLVADLRFRCGGDGWMLRVEDGRAQCLPDHSSDAREISEGAIAAIAAGAQTSVSLRTRGLITGGESSEDGVWDQLFIGRPAAVNVSF